MLAIDRGGPHFAPGSKSRVDGVDFTHLNAASIEGGLEKCFERALVESPLPHVDNETTAYVRGEITSRTAGRVSAVATVEPAPTAQ